ncbi:sensor domain-containing protein [Sutcliffiella sp. NC1]|uniref:sensor domain-containing protein n=1 Tax=Sutcliffiella sp. NC1 TaxID=3004096 RepID=UPI0022DDA7C3|nr:diguanylate cyclase [Sutcliffiella sp. NC1]WBL16165.1 diguanylate cyclase [Sutcliffiella sp. NC1]
MIEQQEYDRILKYMKDIEFALDVSSIVAIADRTGKITYANDKFCEISQYPRSELIGKDHNIVNSNYHPKEFFKEMWKTIGSGKVWKGEIKNKTKNGNYYWVDTTIVPFLDENGKVYQYVSIRNDITKQKEMSERIEYAAYHDSITGLPNKRYLDEQLEKEIEKHYTEKSHFALMFLDLDNFKLVNDTLGHHEGDLFLKELANQLISANIRDSFIARRSGDEFIIIVRNVKEQKEIVQVAKKVLSIFNTGFAKNKTYKNITGSIGVSVFPCNANNSQNLCKKQILRCIMQNQKERIV